MATLSNLARKKAYLQLLNDIEKDHNYYVFMDVEDNFSQFYLCNQLRLYVMKYCPQYYYMDIVHNQIFEFFPELELFKPNKNTDTSDGWWNESDGNDCRKIALGLMIAMCDEN